MIKSKFDTYQFIGQFIMSGLVILMGFLFYAAFFGKKPMSFFSGAGILVFFILILFIIYIIGQMKLNYKTVIIDTTLKEITFKMFILPIKNTYPFEYFDGYVDTTVKDKYDNYKCLYLVKDGKLTYKMSGRFYKNIDEIHEGLSSLKYMGFIKYSVPLLLKIAFHQIIF